MPRRSALAIVFLLVAGIIAVRADDFWASRKWQDWTKEECNKMLHDSPWSRKWSQSISNNGPKLPSVSGTSTIGAAGDSLNEIDYYVQIRSALPVREAVVRQLQLEERYDQLNADQKKSFDVQAGAILDREYSETIVFHFVYETSTASFGRELAQYWQSIPSESAPSEVYLINQRGDRVRPIRIVAPRSAAYEFEMIFPRTVNNEPVLRDGDKTFQLQFPEPTIGTLPATNSSTNRITTPTTIFPAETAVFEFRVDKMIWGGKLAY